MPNNHIIICHEQYRLLIQDDLKNYISKIAEQRVNSIQINPFSEAQVRDLAEYINANKYNTIWCTDGHGIFYTSCSNRLSINDIVLNSLKEICKIADSYKQRIQGYDHSIILHVFDKVPDSVKAYYHPIRFEAIKLPFSDIRKIININQQPKLMFACEFARTYTVNISLLDLDNELDLMSTYKIERWSDKNSILFRDELIDRLLLSEGIIIPDACKNSQDIIGTITDLYRYKLSRNLAKMNDKTIKIIGNDNLEMGIFGANESNYSNEIFRGNMSIDPGSHSFAERNYFRPLQSIIFGAIPIPIGYNYEHIAFSEEFPFLASNNKLALEECLSKIKSIKDVNIEVIINGAGVTINEK